METGRKEIAVDEFVGNIYIEKACLGYQNGPLSPRDNFMKRLSEKTFAGWHYYNIHSLSKP